jgi:hypothetical protein
VQAKMAKSSKIRASRLKYVSTSHVLIPGFETPFDQNLDPTNRWVILANKIPWDKLVKIYENQLGKSNFGASKINGRIAIGSVIIKHLNNLSDRDVVAQLQENVYMQYFVGLSSFCNAPLYDPSLLVEFRNRLGMEELKEINEIIVANWAMSNDTKQNKDADKDKKPNKSDQSDEPKGGDEKEPPKDEELKGSLIIDATAVPQDIAYPTDLNLLSEAREILEALIDHMYEQSSDQSKPRTYRERAHKEYLRVAQNRNPSRKTIRTAIKKQLQYVSRNLKIVNRYMDDLGMLGVITVKQHNYFLRINTLYDQQLEMYNHKKHSVENRIVSLHQPHVRPIVRGKRTAKVEFGAKIQVGLVDGISYLDYLSWDAYNEGQYLQHSVEEYKRRTGYYPSEILADKIYCNRANRTFLKEKKIKLKAKPLGRPTALQNHVSPGERNPIEGKFGQAKTAYGLQRVKARLSNTSASWIAGIILVLNLVKLAGLSAYCLLLKIMTQIKYHFNYTGFHLFYRNFGTI